MSSQKYRPGDIVWAKIGGYPWWPAKAISLQGIAFII